MSIETLKRIDMSSEITDAELISLESLLVHEEHAPTATSEAKKSDADLMALEDLLANDDDDSKAVSRKEKSSAAVKAAPRLREDSSFAEAFSYEMEQPVAAKSTLLTAAVDDCDSSDDEDLKNFLQRKYNEYGCDVNKRLKQQRESQREGEIGREVSAALRATTNLENTHSSGNTSSAALEMHIKNPHNPMKRQSLVSNSFQQAPPQTRSTPESPATQSAVRTTTQSTIFMDPVFGLHIINPLISSAMLVERMSGRKAVPFSMVAYHTQRGDLSQDWVLAGVVVNKKPVKITKKGDPYSSWRLSDLKGDIKMLTLFLFGGAHKDLWKTAEGMCVAVLNPNILEKRGDSGDVACLSIDTAQKVMILGQSKDFGMCKARKRNGDACTAVVNLSECDFCIFHMKQEYGKMSKRSELQSATTGRGLNELRNKVLGKCEVFYGGQSFMAVPARKSAKQMAKDSKLMTALSEYAVSPFASSINHQSKPKTATTAIPYAARDGPVSKLANNVEASRKQRLKDLERLKILQADATDNSNSKDEKQSSEATTVSPSTSKPTIISPSVPEKYKNRVLSFTPQLSADNFSLEVNIGSKRSHLAKLKALQVINKKPIEKIDPNSTRGSREGKRRLIDELNEKFTCSTAKRQCMEEKRREEDRKSRIQRIMDASSSHTNLIDMREQQEREKYFNKIEKKESLEEKMLNTFKVPCKAVMCLKCRYTAFSAADRCKDEKHPLKVIDAEKRFFQCKDCGNRTATVFKLPKVSCKNCHSSRWERTAMIRERKPLNGSEMLSIRGDEEVFLGSVSGNANLNLLVSEE